MTVSRAPLLGLAGAAALCTWFALSEPDTGVTPAAHALRSAHPTVDAPSRALPSADVDAPAPVALFADAPAPLPVATDALDAPRPASDTGLAALGDLTQNKIAKAEKQLEAKEAQLEKLEDQLDLRETALDDAEDLFEQATLDKAQAELDLAAAEQALTDALAMPQGTPEEKAARKAAIKAAKQQLAQAKKALKKANKQIVASTKKQAKLGAAIAKLEQKIVGVEDTIEEIEETLEALTGDFDFQSTHTVFLAGEVVDGEGGPLGFAQITVVDMLRAPTKKKQLIEDAVTPAVYWQGFTREDGGFDAELQLPGHIDEVDVIVTKSGYRGAYSDEKLRETWGPFAPSARQTFTEEQLEDIVIELEETL